MDRAGNRCRCSRGATDGGGEFYTFYMFYTAQNTLLYTFYMFCMAQNTPLYTFYMFYTAKSKTRETRG